jgi:polyhydroxyalkanoate synthesis regulator phasin
MARRFQETVNIRQQDLSTGAAQGASSLLNRLQQFGRSTDKLIGVVETQRGAQEAQAVELQKVGGVTQAPERREAGIVETVLTGGVSTAQYNKSLQTAYLAGLGNDTKEAINAIEAENPDNIALFNEKAAGYASGVLKGVDPTVRQQVSQFIDNTISNSRLRVHRKTIAKNKSIAASESLAAVNSFANESARLSREGNVIGSGESLIQSFDIIDGMVEAGDLLPDRAATMKREIERESTEQKIRGEFDTVVDTEGPAVALDQLEEISNKIPKGWTPDEWDTFIKSERASIGQELTKAAKAASEVTIEQAREISNLKIQASTGTGDAGKIVQRTETLFNEGKINPSERTSILTNIINQQKAAVKKSKDFSLVADRLAGKDGIVIDTKTIDDFYQETMVEPLSQVPIELKRQSQALFVDKMKRVPTAMKNEITTQLRSGNPDLIAEASRLIDMIDDTPGLIDRTFTAHDRAFAEQVVSLSANLEPVEAVKLANDLTDPTNQARIQAVKDVIKTQKLADNYPSIVQDAYNPFGPFEGTQVGEIALPLMTKEYKDLFEAHYEAGMSESAAKEKAIALLKRNWKKSEVTGQVMKYAPDDYYSVAGDVDYIKTQLVNDVNKEFLFAESIKADQVFLQATETTARTASQGEPEYRVMLLRDGSITPLYGFTWKPDQQKQIKKIEAENEAELNKRRVQSGQTPNILRGATLGL